MALPIPDLPVLAEDDSMLSRKFGRELANYFAGSPLNRLSFLRTDHAFLSSAFSHPTTKFLLLQNLSPLAKDPTTLAYVHKADVEPLTGPDPFKKTEEQLLQEFNSDVTFPVVLFLGIDEKKKTGFEWREYKGEAHFAVDVTPQGPIAEKAKSVTEAVKAKGIDFLPGARHVSLNAPEAAIYAQARHMLDWNARNPFCGGCGQKTLSTNSGTKRVCPPTDWAGLPDGSKAPKERGHCPTRKGISNLSFPRTDPTIIVAVVSADGTKLLLGRSKRFPPDWYSTLAGFLEPGESIEEAVRREVYEESGVMVGRVVIHSSQPWPYPANLMIGAIAQATPSGETIYLGNDAELEDAKWFSQDEVREALLVGVDQFGQDGSQSRKEGALRLPPQTAIANRLIDAVIGGYLGAASKI
ncbi:NUDIX hydrolase domain-like protein [Pseudomassariella vexata]|uniref:NAD(+) diphosphatase n=1 Tax=Pseudomassariella vexata TaxID=1141098 RepID=A0A1Y2EDR7_9PEZI|nr:NUDIX hydrolase domain-like protein [Pseudomassariella vexata]ORY69700.1 NUDIX hydrolase domain-like protein [Pseudomassariella vexata]